MARFLLAVSLLAPLRCRGQGFLDQVKEQAGHLQQQAQDASKSLSDHATEGLKVGGDLGKTLSEQVGPALDLAKNATADLTGATEHGAAQVLLWASGKCPELQENVSAAPEYLARKLVAAFSSSKQDPSESDAACRGVVAAALEEAADSDLDSEADQEKLALKMSVEDLSAKICTSDLTEALRFMEKIRKKYRQQYWMAIYDRLLLMVLTPDRLQAALTEYCGSDAEAASQLFSDRPVRGTEASTAPALLPVAAAVALLLVAAIVARRRMQPSEGPCLLGVDANDAERGLTAVTE